jgi:serine/threonine protein kinase
VIIQQISTQRITRLDRYRLLPVPASFGWGRTPNAFCGVAIAGKSHYWIKMADPARAEGVRYVENERRTLHRFRHPGIVRMVDSGRAAIRFVDGKIVRPPYVVLEKMDRDVHAWLSDPATRYRWRDACAVLGAVGRALVYLHRNRLIHGDVKADNVLVRQTRGRIEAKLADFGTALGASRTRPRVLYGNPNEYQPLDDAWSRAVDVYSFGALTAIVTVHGHFLPYVHDRSRPFRFRDEVPEAVRPALVAFIRRCTAFEAADRPATLGDVWPDLAAIIATRRSTRRR